MAQKATNKSCGFSLACDVGSFCKKSWEFIRVKFLKTGVPVSIGLYQQSITYTDGRPETFKNALGHVKDKGVLFKKILDLSDLEISRDTMGCEADGAVTKWNVQQKIKKEYKINDMFHCGDDTAHQVNRIFKEVCKYLQCVQLKSLRTDYSLFVELTDHTYAATLLELSLCR